MKVTAILPDELVDEVQKHSGGKNITDSLNRALTEWVKMARLRKLNQKIRREPLEFQAGFTAHGVRQINRRR